MIPLQVVDAVPSTQDALKARADSGGGEAALLALRQTAGRGRLGRTWAGADGNLALSVLLHPGGVLHPGHWALLAAVALAGVVATVPGGAAVRLKWPNDLLLDGAKLAGILIEAGSAGGRPWLVAGFGVNLAAAPGIGRPTAHLAGAAAPEPFARALLAALDTWRGRYRAEGFAPIRAAWCTRGPAPGDPVPGGAFEGIDDDGALRILGGARVVSAGA